jgi:hypothetical protein
MEEDVKFTQENDGSGLMAEVIFRPNQFPQLVVQCGDPEYDMTAVLFPSLVCWSLVSLDAI